MGGGTGTGWPTGQMQIQRSLKVISTIDNKSREVYHPAHLKEGDALLLGLWNSSFAAYVVSHEFGDLRVAFRSQLRNRLYNEKDILVVCAPSDDWEIFGFGDGSERFSPRAGAGNRAYYSPKSPSRAESIYYTELDKKLTHAEESVIRSRNGR